MSTRCQIEFYSECPGNSVDAKPDARIYQHSDGYPENMLPELAYLEGVLSKNLPRFGSRLDDPEWCASEFVNQFRLPSDQPYDPMAEQPQTAKPYGPHPGSIYVTQELHSDIAYLYRVTCHAEKWRIDVYLPTFEDYPGSKLLRLEFLEPEPEAPPDAQPPSY